MMMMMIKKNTSIGGTFEENNLGDTAVGGGLDVAEVADVTRGGLRSAVILLRRVEVRPCRCTPVRVVAKLVYMESVFALKEIVHLL
jgi:hypothetical protein